MILAAHVTKVASNSLIIKQELHCLNWPLNMGIKKKTRGLVSRTCDFLMEDLTVSVNSELFPFLIAPDH